MKIMLRISMMALTLVLAGNASAALVWSDPYTVDAFWMGDAPTGSNYVTSVTIKETPTGCASVSSNVGYKTFSFWSSSVHSAMSQMMLSQAAYAHASSLKVKIQYDNASCDTNMGWYMRGIKVLSD